MLLKLAASTDVGCIRTNNEDNYCASSDLCSGIFASATTPWGAEQVINLGPKGVLLVVADGMGGTNAGEVASQRAVSCVAQYFAPWRITPDVTSNADNVRRFMEQAIVACDVDIKHWGDANPESAGMGTTIVMGWILNGMLYVAWCGDSRAYVYHPANRAIFQVSKDHSYVQLLVDTGTITREAAFDHPKGNIITRSLSHGQPDAIPQSLPEPYPLCDGDIVLLCSDGLSGMLHDPEMAQILAAPGTLEDITQALINAARAAGGKDNITAVLCQVVSGGFGTEQSSAAFFAKTEAALNGPCAAGMQPEPAPLFAGPAPTQATPPPYNPAPQRPPRRPFTPTQPQSSLLKKILFPVLIALAVILAAIVLFTSRSKQKDEPTDTYYKERPAHAPRGAKKTKTQDRHATDIAEDTDTIPNFVDLTQEEIDKYISEARVEMEINRLILDVYKSLPISVKVTDGEPWQIIYCRADLDKTVKIYVRTDYKADGIVTRQQQETVRKELSTIEALKSLQNFCANPDNGLKIIYIYTDSADTAKLKTE